MWTNPKSRGKKVYSAHHKAEASQRAKPRISDTDNSIPSWKGSREEGIEKFEH